MWVDPVELPCSAIPDRRKPVSLRMLQQPVLLPFIHESPLCVFTDCCKKKKECCKKYKKGKRCKKCPRRK